MCFLRIGIANNKAFVKVQGSQDTILSHKQKNPGILGYIED